MPDLCNVLSIPGAFYGRLKTRDSGTITLWQNPNPHINGSGFTISRLRMCYTSRVVR